MGSDQTSRVGKILDAYLERVARGAAPDKAALLAEHPELADSLDACLASLAWIDKAAHDEDQLLGPLNGDAHTDSPNRTLGDFRLLPMPLTKKDPPLLR